MAHRDIREPPVRLLRRSYGQVLDTLTPLQPTGYALSPDLPVLPVVSKGSTLPEDMGACHVTLGWNTDLTCRPGLPRLVNSQ